MKAESGLEHECDVTGCPSLQQFSDCLRHHEASIFFLVDAIGALTHRREPLLYHRGITGCGWRRPAANLTFTLSVLAVSCRVVENKHKLCQNGDLCPFGVLQDPKAESERLLVRAFCCYENIKNAILLEK